MRSDDAGSIARLVVFTHDESNETAIVASDEIFAFTLKVVTPYITLRELLEACEPQSIGDVFDSMEGSRIVTDKIDERFCVGRRFSI